MESKSKSEIELSRLSDELLMARYQEGDFEAFSVLYARCSPKIYGYLYHKLGSLPLAEEAFQNTFLKLHKNRGSFDPRRPFTPWLFSVCHSALVDLLRHETRNKMLAREEPDKVSDTMPTMPNTREEPHEVSDTRIDTRIDTKMEAAKRLSSLSEKERNVVSLRFLRDFSFNTIAQQLGLSAVNARKIFSRALQKLRRDGQS